MGTRGMQTVRLDVIAMQRSARLQVLSNLLAVVGMGLITSRLIENLRYVVWVL
jgi:hypothetical protein